MPYTVDSETINNVLVAEDDSLIARGLKHVFKQRGARVTVLSNGYDAIDFIQSEDFLDLAIVDVMMPGLSGLEVVRRIREFGCETPVIIVSGKDTVGDRVRGLEAGADDYMGKPFNTHELVTRAKAICRRVQHGGSLPRVIQVGDTRCDFESHVAIKNGQPVHFTPMEWKVLHYMAARKGHAVSRPEFNVKVLKIPHDVKTRTTDRHAYALRCKLDEDSLNPKHILKVQGVGYRLANFEVIA